MKRTISLTRTIMSIALGALFYLAFSVVSVSAAPTEIVVAADGSGMFRTVQEAIMSVPAGSSDNPVIIRIKPGRYKELVYLQREKRFFRLVGEDATTTVLTYDLHANIQGPDGRPIGTFRTASTVIDADDFIAENITFENSAGPVGQALAIRVEGDRAVFRNCRFLGWQDTILLNRGRHYFEECYITGHVDFIFGSATAFFERCHLHARRDGYITAASTPDDQTFGFVFSNCKITGETPVVRTYLGRPWRAYANVIFLNTEMSEVVRPAGWHNWGQPERERTARFGEFNSRGAGAATGARVSWARGLSATEAQAITLERVLGGTDGWNPRSSRARPVAIYLAGDSTMAEKRPERRPETGWGEHLQEFFRADAVRVENHAQNGRSTRSFIAEGRWQAIIERLREGDYVFIQFGHNDAARDRADRYTPPEDYRRNLIRFVNEVREKRATPVLLTPVMRRRFDARGNFYDAHGEYPDIVRAVAAQHNVPLIDMHRSSERVIRQYGAEESKRLFLWLRAGEHPN